MSSRRVLASVSKTAVNRPKLPMRTKRVQSNDPFPTDFLDFLYALPPDTPSRTATGHSEPLKKRARIEQVETIPIARETITVSRPTQDGTPVKESIFKSNAHRFLTLRYEEASNILTISADGRFGFKWELGLGRLQLTKSALAVLNVLNQSQYDTSDEGVLWVRVAIGLERKNNNGNHLQVSLELNWNAASPHCLRNKTERAISQQVLDTFFSRGIAPYEGEKLSHREFYKAACIPDRDETGFSSLSVPGLNTSLFPFQRRALQWLLKREGVSWNDSRLNDGPGLEKLSLPSTTGLPFSFSMDRDADAKPVYVSHLYHVVTRDPTPFGVVETDFRGGILAEEMGLGKTVETISLICTHTRGSVPGVNIDAAQDKHVSGATLIVTPPPLKNQWVSEFSKHAPHLRVMVYEGLKARENKNDDGLISKLAGYDVVVTTYNVLQAEIYFAQEPPSRSLRHERKYQRPKSPLTEISWWRVCLDEAQQIESGVSNAAKLARWMSRVNAWGITGTPVKEDIKDLWGLLLFLRYEPFASSTAIWEALLTKHQDLFKPLFGRIALRHTKRIVRDELTLPLQRRYVITLPFTAVEEQHYRTQFKRMVNGAGFNENGAPIREGWDPAGPNAITDMKYILAQLRQSILHPSLGAGRHLRTGDQRNKALRTVDEVLDAMIERCEANIKSDQRLYLLAKLEQGRILALQPRTINEAMTVWRRVLIEIETAEKECRDQLQVEVEKDANSGDSQAEHSDQEIVTTRTGECRRQLRNMLDLHHRALFFLASASFQVKSDSARKNADPNLIRELEEQEVSGYQAAKTVRQEILQEARAKALSTIGSIRDKAAAKSFVEVPEIQWSSLHGIESFQVVRTFEQLSDALNQQAALIDEWREVIIGLLLRPLVDGDDEAETTGEEYANSTQVQDDLMVYTLALRAVIADRHYALSGLGNERVKFDTRAAETQAIKGEGHAPHTVRHLLRQREKLMPSSNGSSFRSIISELRELSSKFRAEMAVGSNRAKVELDIVEEHLRLIQKQSSSQTKVVTSLERELDSFVATTNARVIYYRQLQTVSDTVVALELEGVDIVTKLARALAQAQTAQNNIATAKSNLRYLLYLKKEGANADICFICQAPFTRGVLTPCGHQYCKECLLMWFKSKHTCPMCKRPLTEASLHDITLKKQEAKIQEEVLQVPEPSHSSANKPRSFGIYSQFSSGKLEAIKSIDLHGPSFSTKIDTLVRHLLWLRVEDPGAKSIIFCQHTEFFEVLRKAFDQHAIGYTCFNMKNGIERFTQDPAIECFMMDARAHASGLNLVNASHVFLCEPLLNTALELQAIARVDRIGQQHETTVWLYLIDGTVEESIYNLSVQRRLEHLGQNDKGKTKESAEEVSDLNLEAANSYELEKAGTMSKLMSKDQSLGEVVNDNDVWQCLFGHVAKANASADDRMNDPNVIRFLAGEAAEARQAN
ncbi:SNF2 family N-terminal domain-containing protein [Hypoxylon sp. FL1150]|nr:SNF2 family N-terminal domain-containing protein [Hypoxylon sp. FL1150]